jgi:cell wall-associated NlpC family hydrolase
MSLKVKAAAVAVAGLYVYSAGHGHLPGLSAFYGTGTSHFAAVRYAEAQIGKPYAWGGTGPWSFDCSGLAMEAEKAAGFSIPRTSQAQWAALPHISRSQLRPGDLVFYAGSDGSVQSPGHVVIYIGKGKVIQAYAPGYPVEVSSLAAMGAGALTGYARP